MSSVRPPSQDEVDALLLNARLRDELEPYFDESITSLNVHEMPTQVENQFLRSMLAWERAPVLPIAAWFNPPLNLPTPESLSDDALHDRLWDTIQRLFDKRIVLDFADHLNDRQLYTLILRDILPAEEKKIDSGDNYLHWDCSQSDGDPETWLRYYATAEEREIWSLESLEDLPPVETPPFPRPLPRRPL